MKAHWFNVAEVLLLALWKKQLKTYRVFFYLVDFGKLRIVFQKHLQLNSKQMLILQAVYQ